MSQLDLSLHRQFKLPHRRAGAAEFRLDGFNVFNRANLGDPVRYLSSPLFGQPASMLNTMLGTGTPSSGLTPSSKAAARDRSNSRSAGDSRFLNSMIIPKTE